MCVVAYEKIIAFQVFANLRDIDRVDIKLIVSVSLLPLNGNVTGTWQKAA